MPFLRFCLFVLQSRTPRGRPYLLIRRPRKSSSVMNPRVPDTHEKIAGILERIEPASLRAVMSDVFKKLSDSLDYLDLMESCLRSDETLPKSHLVIRLVEEKAESLIFLIETQAKSDGGVTRDIYDLLDGTSFAIRHELKRVSELPLSYDAARISECRAQLARANGLLRNCFQQSVISLAVAFDSSITGSELFGDLKLKHEQSILLLEALKILGDQVGMAEQDRSLDSYFALTEGLKLFEQGYMSYLMYRDWAEFELLSGRVAASRTEAELWPLLHQFGRYIETLTCHVEMRAVLNNQPHTQTEVVVY